MVASVFHIVIGGMKEIVDAKHLTQCLVHNDRAVIIVGVALCVPLIYLNFIYVHTPST